MTRMNGGKSVERETLLKEKLLQVLESKRDEFHLLGYESITIDEIWACVTSKYDGQWPPLYQMVNDIFSLKVTDVMNWLTIGAYRGVIDLGKNSLL